MGELETQMGGKDFWLVTETAQKVVGELKALKAVVVPHEQLTKRADDVAVLHELAVEESSPEALQEAAAEVAKLQADLERLELSTLLSGEHDAGACFFAIHAGAGGTESCDWAEMLLRMYLRYFERNGYKVAEVDRLAGEEAGIRSTTLHVSGPYAYGYLSCERGVHRLVRISPFDSQSRRHTSFAAVDVMPEFDDDIDIEIKDEDLRIDFYRAGGAGGQHVNKVSSAVRITHIPTGIVVQCQNERSQHKNRAQALKVLKSRLYMMEQQKRDEQINKLYGDKGEIAWGNQIRSYVLQPYQLVKDHRTGYETGNVEAILDGELDEFIDSCLRDRAKYGNQGNGK
jgi:peptide chain release factor 2